MNSDVLTAIVMLLLQIRSVRSTHHYDDAASSTNEELPSLLEGSIKDRLLQLRQNRPTSNSQRAGAATVQPFRHPDPPPRSHQHADPEAANVKSWDFYKFRYSGGEHRYHYRFDVSLPRFTSGGQENVVHQATMTLYKDAVAPRMLNDDRNVSPNTVLAVYQCLPGGYRRLISSAVVSLASPGWVSFDATEAVRNWAAEPAANLGLLVECASTAQNVSQIVSFDVHTLPKLPALGVKLYQRVPAGDGRGRLQKRGAASRHRHDRKPCLAGRCCRKHIYVSFKKLKWDWIVEPPGFDAYYCEGRCSRDREPDTNFGLVKKALRTYNVANLTNSCAATKYSPLTVWHYDAQGYLVHTVKEDMIVDRCGCT